MKIATRYLLALLSFIVFSYIFLDIHPIIEHAKNIDLLSILLILILTVTFSVTNGYVNNHYIPRAFNIKTPLREWLGLSFVNSLANYIFPAKTGTLVKATYLKRKYNLDITKSAAILAFSSYISIQTLLALLTICLSLLKEKRHTPSAPIWLNSFSEQSINLLIYTSSFLFTIGLAGLALSFKLKLNNVSANSHTTRKITRIIGVFHEALTILSKNPQLIFATVANSIISLCISIAIFKLSFYAVGQQTDLVGLLVINLANSMSFFISIFPGNLFTQEIIITLSSDILMVSLEAGFVAAAIIRAGNFLVTFILGAFFYHFLDVKTYIKPKKLDK